MNDDAKLPLTSELPTETLLAQLREQAPHLFSEGKVDWDKLRATLGDAIDTRHERYGLSWAGKAEAFRAVQTPSVGTLLPMPEESVNFDTSENLIIEGDNLEVLKLLQKSYHGKVKMIYIDPPYNTGNEFIYPDNYREGLDDYLRYSGQVSDDGLKQTTNTETSGRFHSKWLNMMYPRLFLARNLLRDDGVIFVSIDDNEAHNLRLLMDEVFGEENFKGQITRATGTPTGQGTGSLVNEKDYMLVYSRTDAAEFIGLEFGEDDKKKYDAKDGKGRYLTRPLRKTGGEDRRIDRPTMYYPVTAPDGTPVYPVGPGGYESRWRCGPATYQNLLSEGFIEWKKVKDEGGSENWRPYQKFYMEGRTKQASNLWTDIEGNKKASREVSGLLGDKIFDFPKPVEMIKLCCQIAAPTGIVLDFFAGSGTTAHAILDLNNQDGGNRKFILVQLPEKTETTKYPTIAHITRERVRRVISKLNEVDAGKLNLVDKAAQDRGFRAFRLSSSNFKIWDANHAPANAQQLAEQLQLYADNIEGLRSQDDILFELILKSGLPLSSKVERIEVEGKPIYAIAEGQLLICLEDPINEDLLRGMMAKGPLQVICLDAAFQGNDPLKTNAVLEAKSHGIMFRTV